MNQLAGIAWSEMPAHVQANQYKSKFVTTVTVAIQVAEDLGPSRSGEVVMSQARLWLRYATVMIRSKKMKEAASANAEAVRLLSVVDETILTQLVLEQKRIIEFSLLEFSFMPRRKQNLTYLFELFVCFCTGCHGSFILFMQILVVVHTCDMLKP